RFVGLEIDRLEPMTFSTHPVMLRIGGDYYVRSIQKVNADGSLTFYCAIDEGLVLTMARGVDLLENLAQTFETVKRTIPQPKLVIGCECILRRLEILEKGMQNEAAALMNAHNVVGFHTYGEQYNGVHVNQTFTGVALGD
ncbi:MAG: FIST C-terminal domain-containing protein, partial [Nitrospinae bacterium]|nr:FIST C-terminal domain-containing protein [Nitrospinota bacterium]